MVWERDKALDLLGEAAEVMTDDPLRQGHLLALPHYGQVVVTGDFHGYRPNFEKLRYFADLDRCPDRHVLLHELIHLTNHAEGPCRDDDSCLLLLDALEWKVRFPEQVHFMLGNHDLAQMTNREITKSGGPSLAAFNQWVLDHFGSAGSDVLAGIDGLYRTFPLAVRCPNRIWLSHSLPGPCCVDLYDMTVFDRQWEEADLLPGGAVYEMVWGRGHDSVDLRLLAAKFDVDFFIMGHQGQDEGFSCQFDCVIILASDHPQGCFLPLDLGRRYDFDSLVGRIRYFSQIVPPQRVHQKAAD